MKFNKKIFRPFFAVNLFLFFLYSSQLNAINYPSPETMAWCSVPCALMHNSNEPVGVTEWCQNADAISAEMKSNGSTNIDLPKGWYRIKYGQSIHFQQSVNIIYILDEHHNTRT